MRILGSNGNVGIGTVSPQSILNINDTTPCIFFFFRTDDSISTGNAVGRINWLAGEAGGRGIVGAVEVVASVGSWSDVRSPTDMTFSTTKDGELVADEKVRIQHDGKVGIGRTNPQSTLDVKGGSIRLTDGESDDIIWGVQESGDDGVMSVYENGAVRWRLDGRSAQPSWVNAGNFGIGIVTPTHKLNVQGTTNLSGNTLIERDLNVTGKIHNSLSHIFGLSTVIGAVVSNEWQNITMNQSHVDAQGFGVDNNNVSITVESDGHYTITYGMGILDSAPSPNAHVAMRVVADNVEIAGSYIESDTARQSADRWLEHTTHVELTAGQIIHLQYISDDETVTIAQHDTWATQPFNAYGYIQEIIV